MIAVDYNISPNLILATILGKVCAHLYPPSSVMHVSCEITSPLYFDAFQTRYVQAQMQTKQDGCLCQFLARFMAFFITFNLHHGIQTVRID